MVAGIQGEMKKCGSGCKLSYVNVSIPDIATRIQPQVQSALTRDPRINYVIALYDSAEAPFALAGIRAAGRQGHVKVVTFNGTPSVLKLVQTHDVEIDIGENLRWIAMAIMDQHMRLMAGLKPIFNPHVPLRIFDAANISATGNPPRDSTGFGSQYVQGYRNLWELSK
jgi:ribose transport system substrate-binding protein